MQVFSLCRSKIAPPKNTRTRAHNLVRVLPGLKQAAKQLGTKPQPEEVWRLLFCDKIIQEILKWSNVNIEQRRASNKYDNNSNLREISITELYAFFGLLFFTEVFKSSKESLNSFYATDGTGRDIFRATMNRKRFEIILSSLRFDDPTTRDARKAVDRAAPISAIFDQFILNCQQCYTIGEYACVDEMLVPFRGRCRFRIYMPKKPAKYGIKIVAMTDARTGYLLNAYIYTGKDSDGTTLSQEERRLPIPCQSVIRLSKPIIGTNRNITADNWFSSIPLIEELRKRNLTFVGTMKKNKAAIPKEFLPNRSRQVETSLFGFQENITMVSHVPKKNRSVVLVSSMHHTNDIDDESKKPEIILFYNMTKGGVDSMDQKIANYTSNRRSRRWPMKIFYSLLDISGVNSYILYNSYKDINTIERLDFVKALAKALIHPFLIERSHLTNLPQSIKIKINEITQVPIEESTTAEGAEERLTTRKYCKMCPPRIRRKTGYICTCCSTPICLSHAKKICENCVTKKKLD